MTTLALIGKGRWGTNYLNESKKIPSCQIKYVRGRDYLDLHQKADIDGIIVATPAATHLSVIQQFPHMPLLVEKPLTVREGETFSNTQIMVGHTYLYQPSIQALQHTPIQHLKFNLLNTETYNSDTSVLWELGPHGISIAYFLFGKPTTIHAEVTKDQNVHVVLSYPHTTCDITFGWSNQNQEKSLVVDGKEVDISRSNPSALENELRAFINFIDGEPQITNLDHALAVTAILAKIEKLL